MVKTFGLTKRFGSLVAVDNLNLEIKGGEIFGFIGPNGAGKTTTIKMLTGILAPTSGRVEVGGFDLQTEPIKAKRLLGYIPDDPYVYPELTGREFLFLVGRLFEVENLEKKIKDLLPTYRIENIADAPFKDYSRGNKQKLAILAAFLHSPQVLIIDEPILGLDPQSARVTIKWFKEFAQKGGTIFLSTHTLSVADEICNRVGIIDQGKLIFEGSAEKLKRFVKEKRGNLEELYLKLLADD